jgi:hypothetical protein
MHRLASLFALFLGLCSPAAAQASRGDVSVRFLAERVPPGIGKVALAAEDAVTEPFDLPMNHLSETQTAPARAFVLRAVEKNATMAKIALPEQGKAFIILLIPSKEGGYQPIVIASEDPAFRPGDVYFYNHADKPILGYVGTSKFILQPSSSQIIRPAGAREENAFYDVGFGVREKEGDRALSATRWPVDNKTRSYVLFFVNPTTNRIDFRAVDEFVPADS